VVSTRRGFCALLGTSLVRAAPQSLLEQWQQIAAETDGTVGAAAFCFRSGERVSIHGQERFPMASVCKLPIAMRILRNVDEGKLRFEDSIEVLRRDILPWVSPVAERWPKQRRFVLDELLRLMIAQSDNTAVQTLFRVSGEKEGVTTSLRQWQVQGVRVDRYEGECYLASHGVTDVPSPAQWQPSMFQRLISQVPVEKQYAGMRQFLHDPRDTATPDGTVELLSRAFRGELLSPAGTARLKAYLEATETGKGRLRGLLPARITVAHKTGTTSTVKGLNGATNDVGVITLPGKGGQFAIAVYMKASTLEETARDRVIARIARAAYDYWVV
jgi:beta-lactamase class A